MTEQSKQAKQKLLEIFSNLNRDDLFFLVQYLDESPTLDEAQEAMAELLEEELPCKHGKLEIKKAILVVDNYDPKELVDLYVEVNEHKKLLDLIGTNRITVALRMKGIG